MSIILRVLLSISFTIKYRHVLLYSFFRLVVERRWLDLTPALIREHSRLGTRRKVVVVHSGIHSTRAWTVTKNVWVFLLVQRQCIHLCWGFAFPKDNLPLDSLSIWSGLGAFIGGVLILEWRARRRRKRVASMGAEAFFLDSFTKHGRSALLRQFNTFLTWGCFFVWCSTLGALGNLGELWVQCCDVLAACCSLCLPSYIKGLSAWFRVDPWGGGRIVWLKSKRVARVREKSSFGVGADFVA